MNPRQSSNFWEYVERIGDDIARSGLFGCTNASQGKIFAASSWIRGIDPLITQEIYHVMHDKRGGSKLSKKADATLAELRVNGGDFQIMHRTPDIATITVTWKGEEQKFSLSWEEAQRETFVYEGKVEPILKALAAGRKPGEPGLVLSPNYATQRSRMQMLWARVSTDAVRAMAPELSCGFYPAEVLSDLGLSSTEENAISQIAAETVEASTETADLPDEGSVDTEPAESVTEASETSDDDKPSGPGLATEFQRANFGQLWRDLGHSTDDLTKLCTQMKVGSLAECTKAELDHMISRLEEKLADRGTAAPAAEPVETAAAPRTGTELAATAEQLELIRAYFVRLGVPIEVQAQAVQKRKHTKLEEFTPDEADNLIETLSAKAEQVGISLFSESMHAQVGDEQVGKIKDLVRMLSQDDPELPSKIKAKLVQEGLDRISDLTIEEATRLEGSLETKQLDQFFKSTLSGWSKKGQ